jgi:hypothetical protein
MTKLQIILERMNAFKSVTLTLVVRTGVLDATCRLDVVKMHKKVTVWTRMCVPIKSNYDKVKYQNKCDLDL